MSQSSPCRYESFPKKKKKKKKKFLEVLGVFGVLIT
jgi:hypothetical protein